MELNIRPINERRMPSGTLFCGLLNHLPIGVASLLCRRVMNENHSRATFFNELVNSVERLFDGIRILISAVCAAEWIDDGQARLNGTDEASEFFESPSRIEAQFAGSLREVDLI